MNKLFLLTLLIVGLSFSSFVLADSDDIADALEDRLSDSFDFDSDLPANVHPDTKLRRFEDGNPMWLQLYVRPRQNQRFNNYHAKGFVTGRSSRLYTNIPNISSSSSFKMRHESPWSYKFSGIGKVMFYHQTNYRDRFHWKASTDDRPKLHTFGSSSNASKCRCSASNPNCSRKWCGHRETIGSIKFCPGLALYTGRDYVGKAAVMFKCDPRPKQSHCFTSIPAAHAYAKSLHFDALVDKVHLYSQANCRAGGDVWYGQHSNGGIVPLIHPGLRKIRSIKIVFKQ